MATPYQDVWDKFNIATVNYSLDDLAPAEQEAYLMQIMDNAIDKAPFSTEYFDLNDRDDVAKEFTDDLDSKVLQIIAEYMISVWVGRMVHNTDILKQFMSSSAVKKFSPASHLGKLSEVLKETTHTAENLYKQYSMSKNISKLE